MNMSQGYNISKDGKYLYSIDGTECSLRGIFEDTSELVIPESVDGRIVTKVSATVFEDVKEYIESIIFSKTVKYLEYKSFVNMIALKKVVLSGSVSILPRDSFVECNALEEIVIPKGVCIVQDMAIHDCANLRRIVIYEDNIILTEHSFVETAISTYKCEFVYPKKKLDGTPDYRYNPIYSKFDDCISGKRNKNVTLFVHRDSSTEKTAKQCGYRTAIIDE